MKLIIENFRGIKNKTIEFADKGVVLLSGRSGSGKSSTLTALFYVLYGGLKNVCHRGTRKCSVEFFYRDMAIKRHQSILTLRYVGQNSNQSDSKNSSSSLIEHVGDEAQSIIDGIFGKKDTFFLACFIAQKSTDNFLLSSPSEKMSFLETILLEDKDISNIKSKVTERINGLNSLLKETTGKMKVMDQMFDKFDKSFMDRELEILRKLEKFKKEQPVWGEYLDSVKEESNESSEKEVRTASGSSLGKGDICNLIKTFKEYKSLCEAELGEARNQKEELVKKDIQQKSNKKLADVLDSDKERCIRELGEITERIEKAEEGILSKESLDRHSNCILELEGEKLRKKMEQSLRDGRETILSYKKEEEMEWAKKLGILMEEWKANQDTNEEQLTKEIEVLEEISSLLKKTKENDHKWEDVGERIEKLCEKLNILSWEKDGVVLVNEGKEEVLKKISELGQIEIDEPGAIIRHLFTCPNCKECLCLENGSLKVHIKESDKVVEKKALATRKEYEVLYDLFSLYANCKDIHDEINSELRERKRDIHILKSPNIKDGIRKGKELLQKKESLSKGIEELQFIIDTKKYSKTTTSLEEKWREIKKEYDKRIWPVSTEKIDGMNLEDLEARIQLHKSCVEKFGSYLNERGRTIDRLSEIERKLLGLPHDSTDYDLLIKDIDAQIAKIRERQERIVSDLEFLQEYEKYDERRTQYDYILASLKELDEEEKRILDDKKCYDIIMAKVKETESEVLGNIIVNINIVLQGYLDAFFPDQPINVSLSPFKEGRTGTKNEIVCNCTYGGNSFLIDSHTIVNQVLSGGEFDRVNLAMLLAIGKIIKSPIMMLDESLSSLDDVTCNLIIDNIKQEKNKLILIVLHQSIQGNFDNVIHF